MEMKRGMEGRESSMVKDRSILKPENAIAGSKRRCKVLIACEIFAHEVQAVLPPDEDFEIVWLEAALHASPARLEEALHTALSKSKAQEADVRILFGSGCHPTLCDLAREHGAALSPVKNCIEAFCGERTRELEANRTMIMTPGWVRAWPSIMTALGWNEIDVRMNLGRYDRILLLEPNIDPLTEEEILAFFDLTQVPLELQPLDLGHFRAFLAEALR
ncbi:MAG: DUF1638 domain-containing protein [Syntrophobacteraceae bacterium]